MASSVDCVCVNSVLLIWNGAKLKIKTLQARKNTPRYSKQSIIWLIEMVFPTGDCCEKLGDKLSERAVGNLKWNEKLTN